MINVGMAEASEDWRSKCLEAQAALRNTKKRVKIQTHKSRQLVAAVTQKLEEKDVELNKVYILLSSSYINSSKKLQPLGGLSLPYAKLKKPLKFIKSSPQNSKFSKGWYFLYHFYRQIFSKPKYLEIVFIMNFFLEILSKFQDFWEKR